MEDKDKGYYHDKLLLLKKIKSEIKNQIDDAKNQEDDAKNLPKIIEEKGI
jgi:hypothetical protein